MRGVATPAGQIALMRTPSGARFDAVARTHPITAAFVSEYIGVGEKPTSPLTTGTREV